MSDWCECAAMTDVPVPPQRPAPGPDAPLVRVGAALTWCGEPVRLIGYGNYGIIAESAFDHEVFFDRLVADGVGMVRIWGQYQWANDLMPFAGSRGSWDLTAPNPAFDARLRAVMEAAAARGIVVMLTLFDSVGIEGSATDGNRWINSPYRAENNAQAYLRNPSGFNSTDGPVWTEVNQPYLERTIDAVCDLPNVIYEIMNEPEGSGGDPGRGTPAFVDHAIAEVHRLLDRDVCTGSRIIASNDDTLRTLSNPLVDVIAVHVAPDAIGRYRRLGKPVVISNDGDVSQVGDSHGFGTLGAMARQDRIAAYASGTFGDGAPGELHLEILDKDMHGASWRSQDYQPRASSASAAILSLLTPHVVTPPRVCGVTVSPDAGEALPSDGGVLAPDASPPIVGADAGSPSQGPPLRPPSSDTELPQADAACGCASTGGAPSAGWVAGLVALLWFSRRLRLWRSRV